MHIHLVTNTPDPLKAIGIPYLNMGIGRDIKSFNDITHEEAADALKEIFKSHLDAPLEFASFNFFLEDIPLFLRAQLVRHRVGFGYAERSLRFYDANLRNAVEAYDFEHSSPTITEKKFSHPYFGDRTIKDVYKSEMERQMYLYGKLIEEGVDQQDARNIVGVWYGTAMQITCTYRAMRNMLADRLSSQAHPLWQFFAKEMKQLVTEVSPELGAGLIDGCEMDGKCRWRSKNDRDCDSCIKRGLEKAHTHKWELKTSLGPNNQCLCGAMRQNLLNSASNSSTQEKR